MSDLLTDLQNKSVKSNTAQDALKFLKSQGFPTKRLEEWHYTSPKESLAKVRLHPKDTTSEVSADLKSKILQAKNRIVFAADGIVSELTNMSLAVRSDSKDQISDGLQAAAIIASESCHYLKMDSSSKLNVFFIGSSERFSSHALLIDLEPGASLNLTTEVLDFGAHFSAVVPRIEVTLQKESACHWVHIQDQSLNSSQYSYLKVELQEKSQLHFLGLSLGGKQVRNDIQVNIQGSDANVILDGLALGTNDQHFDQTTSINHHIGGSQSFQTFKSILDGHSRSAFSGTVYIAKDAQKANSEQINQNLLLSDSAEADSRPMLKIYADDVKAGHGSTVGQVSDDELFYLRSRGISKSKAIEMLAFGFAAEILFKVQDVDLRNELEALVRKKFKGLQY